MAFTITNRAKHLLIIPLNSGESLFLAPGEASGPVGAYELDNNEKVDKLLRDSLITSSEEQEQTPAAAAATVEPQGGADAGTPPDTQTDSALNTGPAPDASSVGPGAPAPGVEGHGGKGRNK
jgi:hypothetical protein